MKVVIKKCLICSKDVVLKYPYQINNPLVACEGYCKKCLTREVSLKLNYVVLQCDYCDKGFYKLKKKVKNYNFCSSLCHDSYVKYVKHIHSSKTRQMKKKYYGRNWLRTRRLVRERDCYHCKDCGISEEDYGKELSVHHIIPFVSFDTCEEANKMDNLISLCEPCHRLRHSGGGHHFYFKLGENAKRNSFIMNEFKEKALEIIELLQTTKITFTDIAKRLGVSVTTVERINQGVRWSSLHNHKIPIREKNKIKGCSTPSTYK